MIFAASFAMGIVVGATIGDRYEQRSKDLRKQLSRYRASHNDKPKTYYLGDW
jgi:hypothetical protein